MVNKDSKIIKQLDEKYDSYATFEKIKIVDTESNFCRFRQASEFKINYIIIQIIQNIQFQLKQVVRIRTEKFHR